MSDAKLEQVRKLLALAGDRGATDHERERAFEAAERLIAKHGLEEALATAEAKGKTDRTVAHEKMEVHAPFATEKVMLYRAVAVPLGVDTVSQKQWRTGVYRRANRSDRKVTFLNVFGRKADLERAELLYTSLLLQQADEFRKAEAEIPAWYTPQEKAAHRRAWLSAYAARIQTRFEELIRETSQQVAEEAREHGNDNAASGMELVLADKQADVADAVKKAFPNTYTTTRKLSGITGYSGGYDAADRANLGGTGVDHGRAGVIGR